ncbi:hypothetical protein CEUSTIGMA_g12073.t1 [Chlamydomonas eustigma]|uniref:Uncharacterized protein n=1 Tax=Chlamydomonas eustigma TaxID=1157962 RepID=A0A250XNZ9_9CHLO|nr:hypothetical protein CEUSTIGMA_g12073.t1 [Chlamydomonas eustigma]|eukprot:GAX84652.1 hypothetical protein CEUSTIGMA_g12073.t1 [Chlamydomonas eustigma]
MVISYLYLPIQFICHVGLDNAGKTTILYKLSLGEVVKSTATIGSNVEMVKYKNIQLEIWDLGGQQNLRPFWATYYKGADAIVMVVDSTDRARVGVAKSELFNLLENEELSKVPILVLANKQDLKDAMTVEEMSTVLSLHSIRNHDWHMQACCAINGIGLMEALAWIHARTKGGGGNS